MEENKVKDIYVNCQNIYSELENEIADINSNLERLSTVEGNLSKKDKTDDEFKLEHEVAKWCIKEGFLGSDEIINKRNIKKIRNKIRDKFNFINKQMSMYVSVINNYKSYETAVEEHKDESEIKTKRNSFFASLNNINRYNQPLKWRYIFTNLWKGIPAGVTLAVAGLAIGAIIAALPGTGYGLYPVLKWAVPILCGGLAELPLVINKVNDTRSKEEKKKNITFRELKSRLDYLKEKDNQRNKELSNAERHAAPSDEREEARDRHVAPAAGRAADRVRGRESGETTLKFKSADDVSSFCQKLDRQGGFDANKDLEDLNEALKYIQEKKHEMEKIGAGVLPEDIEERKKSDEYKNIENMMKKLTEHYQKFKKLREKVGSGNRVSNSVIDIKTIKDVREVNEHLRKVGGIRSFEEYENCRLAWLYLNDKAIKDVRLNQEEVKELLSIFTDRLSRVDHKGADGKSDKQYETIRIMREKKVKEKIFNADTTPREDLIELAGKLSELNNKLKSECSSRYAQIVDLFNTDEAYESLEKQVVYFWKEFGEIISDEQKNNLVVLLDKKKRASITGGHTR